MTKWVSRIILSNGIIFLMTLGSPAIIDRLILVPAFILLRPWTLITYMFLHASFGHIFFNMLSLFFFGPRLELVLGGRKFLLLYFLSGMSGGILSFIFTPHAAILGASGAVYGIMMGFAYFWPTEPMYIWGIFPIQSRWLIIIMTILSLFGGFGFSETGIAHFAHLGGFLGGYLYLSLVRRRMEQPRPPRQDSSLPAPSETDLLRWSNIPREKLHQVNREELERILEKIKSRGVDALTLNERDFLERFSHIS